MVRGRRALRRAYDLEGENGQTGGRMKGARKPARAPGRRRLPGAAAALAVFLAAGGAAAQGGFQAGGWTGGPARDAEASAVTGCVMSLEYGGGESLRLSLSPDGDLGIAIADGDRWPTEGTAYRVGVGLDDTDLGTHGATAADGEHLSIGVPFSAAAIDRLGLADQLHIRLAHKTVNFPLPGIDRALPRLLQCLGRALAPRMGPYGPFAGPASIDGPAAGAGEEKGSSEGEAAVTALLANAGLPDFALVPAGAAPPGALYAWSDGETVGALFVVEAGSVSLELLTTLVLGDVAAHCKGELLHGSRATTLAGDIPARRAVASCWGAGGSRYLAGSAWRAPETMPLVIHRGPTARAAAEADQKLLDAFAARLR